MDRILLFTLLGLCLAIGCSACGGSGSSPVVAADPPEPAFDPSLFDATSATITIPWLPLTPGTTFTYEGETEDGTETIVIVVTIPTRVILGVTCAVVLDRAYLDGELIEETTDWYAQDVDGNLWYLGEDTAEYEGGMIVSTAGSWEAGVDGAVAGILIKAVPVVGDTYQQEYYAGEAEDRAEVVATGVEVVLPGGGTYTGCTQTYEWTPLDPDTQEYKYYAPGVGLVLETQLDGSEPVELVGVTP